MSYLAARVSVLQCRLCEWVSEWVRSAVCSRADAAAGGLTPCLAASRLPEGANCICTYVPLCSSISVCICLTICLYIYPYIYLCVGRDSSVDIATRYGLDGPGIESRWGTRFSAPALGPTQPPIQCVPGLFPGVKRPGRGADHPPPHLAPRLKKE